MHKMLPWYLLYLPFIGGQLLWVLVLMSRAIRDPKIAVHSRLGYLSSVWDILIIRGVAGFVLFDVWIHYPDAFTRLESITGLQFDLNIPPVPPIAFGVGFLVDMALGWLQGKVPLLKRELPSIPDFPEDTKANSAKA